VEVEAAEREPGRRGVHVRVDEGGRQQCALPRDHPAGRRGVGGRTQPGDPAVDDVHGPPGAVAHGDVGDQQAHASASLALVERMRGSVIGA
jgi:hypothetical protein